jgi:hypothetical protein
LKTYIVISPRVVHYVTGEWVRCTAIVEAKNKRAAKTEARFLSSFVHWVATQTSAIKYSELQVEEVLV